LEKLIVFFLSELKVETGGDFSSTIFNKEDS